MDPIEEMPPSVSSLLTPSQRYSVACVLTNDDCDRGATVVAAAKDAVDSMAEQRSRCPSRAHVLSGGPSVSMATVWGGCGGDGRRGGGGALHRSWSGQILLMCDECGAIGVQIAASCRPCGYDVCQTCYMLPIGPLPAQPRSSISSSTAAGLLLASISAMVSAHGIGTGLQFPGSAQDGELTSSSQLWCEGEDDLEGCNDGREGHTQEPPKHKRSGRRRKTRRWWARSAGLPI